MNSRIANSFCKIRSITIVRCITRRKLVVKGERKSPHGMLKDTKEK
jgi:hypothetical protein